jgi:putative Ca2+/H+ antiporter (TMEM165/GDT1 family)
MDFKILATTFGMIFLAELGDKTQLATLCFAAESDSRTSVFIGSAGALVLSSLIGVLCGGFVSRILSPEYVRLGAGALFMIIGLWMLVPYGK